MSVSIYCPHCHRHTSLEAAQVPVSYGQKHWTVDAVWKKSADSLWWIGVCNFCKKPVLVRNSGQTIYPAPLPEPTSEDVPDRMKSDLDEAKQCFALGCYRAAAVMARRSMQSAAIDKGAKKDKLVDQIGELAAASIITADLKEWADVVRWVGNDAAHPNGQDVTQEDAEEVLKLAEQFLHVIYVTPATAKRLRARIGR